jgi:uncharacterized protein (UPF0332 family)
MEKIDAEPERATEALSVAAELLVSAKENADSTEFDEAFLAARDSMRIASSAILFRDGCVASDFESTYAYLKKEYGESIPLDEWKEVERISKSRASLLSGLFGAGKKNIENDSKKALEAALKFLKASNEIVYGE